jgi:aminoglycoside phosphotransferase (APT) family kinase protein
VTTSDESPALPWRRTAGDVQSGLTAWARSRHPGAAVSDVRIPDSGMANDTALFRLDDRALVARLAPLPGSPCATFPTFDLDRQRRVIGLVGRRTEVPVPHVVHLEESEVFLGSPFLVVAAVDGVVPSDNPPYLLDPGGWFLQGTPEQLRRLESTTIEVLVRLHALEDDGGDLAFLRPPGRGATMLEKQLGAQREYYEWARDAVAVPVLEEAFDVLERTLPANDRRVLNWGDSRPGNIIYRDFRPVAVLDWEMATIGPPEVDVAWATFFHRFFAGFAEQLGMEPVPAMFEPASVSRCYESLGGTSLEDLTWYEAFAGLRFGIILARMSLRNVAFGLHDLPANSDDLMMFAPLLRTLLERLPRRPEPSPGWDQASGATS